MKINLIAVGKLKENYFKECFLEYEKRLSKYVSFKLYEVLDIGYKNITDTKKEEAKNILKVLNKSSYIILLDVESKELSSIDFAKKIDNIFSYQNSEITFIIGGSYGFDLDIYKLCNDKISLSKMTFPHMLCRIVFIEQLYRAFKILNNEEYHK